MIARGEKTIETRRWKTNYRGDLLIASCKRPLIAGMPCGYALCIADLYDCRSMQKVNETRACCEIYAGAYAWFLKDIRQLMPFTVRGQLGLYEVDDLDIRSSIITNK